MTSFLFVLNTYDASDHTPEGMLSQLAVEMVVRGHEVTVVHANEAGLKAAEDRGPQSLLSKPRSNGRFARAVSVLSGSRRREVEGLIGSHRFDVVVLATPAMKYGKLLQVLRSRGQARVTIVGAYDFYPQAWGDLGIIRNTHMLNWLTKLERSAVAGSAVFALSAGSAQFARMYYQVRDVFVVPPFGPPALSLRPSLREDGPTRFVFGARVFYGRWVEGLIRLAASFSDEIVIDCYGGGPLRAEFEAKAATQGVGNIRFLDSLDRDRYVSTLLTYHAGLATTDAFFQAPSFPSKFIDYMRVGLPIVAVVDDRTDYVFMIEEAAGCGFGGRSSSFPTARTAVEKLLASRKAGHLPELGERGRAYYSTHHTLGVAADQFEAYILDAIRDMR